MTPHAQTNLKNFAGDVILACGGEVEIVEPRPPQASHSTSVTAAGFRPLHASPDCVPDGTSEPQGDITDRPMMCEAQ